jgi:ABC-type branched-subunit amino acid transport system substrate-binding protein
MSAGWTPAVILPASTDSSESQDGGYDYEQSKEVLRDRVGAFAPPLPLRLPTRKNKVVIGDIDDMSGVYANMIGPGGVEAAKMAIADFGGSVLGNKIELLVSDHQNKPDLGAENSASGQTAMASPWCSVAPIPGSVSP